LADQVRKAFAEAYITPAGRMMSDSGTAYSLAIGFALLPSEAQRQAAGERLAHLVRVNQHHIPTGFVGTPLICDALCQTGHPEDAYQLLMQTTCPSWLYPVTQGATTIWERWDAILPDGAILDAEMLSFNHYAFGAVADWMHRTLAGLAPLEPGYRRIGFSPVPGGGLSYAKASHRTPYGLASSGWRISDSQIHYELVLPPNTSGWVNLRELDNETIEVGSGTHRWVFPIADLDSRKRLSINSRVVELMAETHIWNAILEAMTRYIPELEHRIGSLHDYSSLTLKQIAFILPRGDAMLREIEEILASKSQKKA
jgi:alpha-L-rhamnosidase